MAAFGSPQVEEVRWGPVGAAALLVVCVVEVAAAFDSPCSALFAMGLADAAVTGPVVFGTLACCTPEEVCSCMSGAAAQTCSVGPGIQTYCSASVHFITSNTKLASGIIQL